MHTKNRTPHADRERVVGMSGQDLLHDPALNKGTAFTEEEREAFGLRGLLPPRVATMEEQADRILENVRGHHEDLDRFIEMIALQDRNETLFYRVILDHLDEMLPILYTPTVGRACQQYGHIFRRSRGIFVSANDRGRVKSVLRNWPASDVRVIVVTDGERILGLGDLGANGMGIPVGKLSLYTACSGIHPRYCLPVTLDVGTDNPALLADPLYLGLHQQRLRGADYDSLVDEFVMAVQELYPGVLLQFEDFANANAFPLLERYRDRICTFNDDIQGTAAVTLAGLYSALRITGGRLNDQRILFLGSGAAGVGVCDLVVKSLVAEGVTEQEARETCWLFDSKGLVISERADLNERKRGYAHPFSPQLEFSAAVDALKPTAIIGVSGKPRMFNRAVIESMSGFNERPIIFSLSNPTSHTECTAEDAYAWSGGHAVFTSGSPFGPVEYKGRTFVPGQGNNAYIFPGVGLGVMASRARHVTDTMFLAAARSLAMEVTEADLEKGSLFPSLKRIRDVSVSIATAVVGVAREQGLARETLPDDVVSYLRSLMYVPEYRTYVK